jgi:hypothetical protein
VRRPVPSAFPWISALGLALAPGIASCDGCEEQFEHLTVSIGGKGLQTSPKWGGTWQHAGGPFHAEAIWGPADRAPTVEAFELYDVTTGPAERRMMVVTDCRVGDGTHDQDNACRLYYMGGSCPYAARRWAFEALEPGRSYLLVHRLSQGNGKKLSTAGPVESFEGEPAHTMKLELKTPD